MIRIIFTVLVYCFVGWFLCDINPDKYYTWYSGIYTGYHFGFESKTGAYVVGALLLWVAGGEILLRNVMHMI